MTSDEMSARAPLARREREWTPARSWFRLLHDELSDISPVHWSRMLRVTVLVALLTIISMALRVPEAALSAYMIFFVSKPDVATTRARRPGWHPGGDRRRGADAHLLLAG